MPATCPAVARSLRASLRAPNAMSATTAGMEDSTRLTAVAGSTDRAAYCAPWATATKSRP